jgi:PEP-CTERM motif
MSHRFAAALLLVVAAASPLSAQSVTYSQGTFDSNQWSFSTITQSGPVSGTEQLVGTGGNSGSNWLHTFSLGVASGANRYRVANINNTFTYDPRVNGALASLSFSFDLLGLSTSGFSEPFFGSYVPTLRQNGLYFFLANGGLRPTTSWSTYSISSSSFVNWLDPNNQGGSLRPDFSAAGTTMEFGYIMSGGGECPVGLVCSAASFASRLDNFSVTANAVSTVPEPSTYALMAAGLGVLMLVQRRRRLSA